MSDPDPITRLDAVVEGHYRIERGLGEGGMAALRSASAWGDMLVEGARTSLGMADFDGDLTPEMAGLLRAYVARQPALLYESEQGRG